ncbi:peptidoglycan DD-metalloendopeptidase family protein [Tenacibaculum halocynthiae]|uniref:peptidoglycan DD-metalloendopeptidase family protein n=1 Tax=Tenacibaculum halocynthiae TaxID=1254437 RepID=UPI003894D63B
MKSLFAFFLILFLSTNNYGQIHQIFEYNIDSILNFKNIVKDSISNSFMEENWDTSTYNPYKIKIKKYPFNIVFKDSIYSSPIDRKKVITSRYGWRRRRAHKGIDIDLVTGDDVKVMLDGKVRYVNYHSGHGKVVVVRHYNGLETSYSHLSKQLVKVNDTVVKGQIIGKGGTTGNARGSHLHLEVSFKGTYIYPEYLFSFNEKNNIRSQNIWVTKNWVTPYIHNSKRQSSILICNTYEEAIKKSKKTKQVYVIKKGDTLSKISSKHRISITSICKTNSIRKSSTLKIGQKLVLIQ